MSFHAVVGENHGVESERTDQTLRSPLNKFLAIFYILSGARKKIRTKAILIPLFFYDLYTLIQA